MNLFELKLRLLRAQFALLMLGMLLQRSPVLKVAAVLEKALKQPLSHIVRMTTWTATSLGVFHATAGATGLQTQRDLGRPTDSVNFDDVLIGEEVLLTIRLDGVNVDYWEVDANSDFVDGLEFVSDVMGEVLQGPFERQNGPGGVNEYYRIKSQFLVLAGTPTTPSRIATLEPDGFYSNRNVLGIKAYDSTGFSEGSWYDISIEVPPTEPEIVHPPASTRVSTGGRAQFFFESSGVVDSIQWFRDGVELVGETGTTLIIESVSPAAEGVYTVEVTNSAGTAVSAGGTLTIDDAATSELVNLATRGFVGSGSDIMIGGLTVQGGSTKTVLVRGLGPQLTEAGVPGALEDPELRVFQTIFGTPVSSQLLVTNDDWESGPNAAELASALAALNKPLVAGSKDAALLLTLNEGVYTFQLSGVEGAEGVGLIELFVVE